MIWTKNWPLASGRVSKKTGFIISGALMATSIGLYMHLAHPLTAGVAGGIWIGYSLMYTPLK